MPRLTTMSHGHVDEDITSLLKWSMVNIGSLLVSLKFKPALKQLFILLPFSTLPFLVRNRFS